MRLDWKSVEGHRTVRVVGENIAASVDVDRGAHIFELTPVSTGKNLLYADPRGLAAHEVGGWYELFPNAGPDCEVNGRVVPTHGDVRDLEWHVVAAECAPTACVLHVRVISRCLPLALSRRLTFHDGTGTVQVEEKVTNLGPGSCPYLWGHHITFGGAVAEGARIVIPADAVFTREQYQPAASCLLPGSSGPLDQLPDRRSGRVDLSRFPSAPAAEMLFVNALAKSRCTVRQPRLGLAVDVEWDVDAFPALWLWMENRGTFAPPFYGETVALAVEPQASDVPSLAAAVEAGSAPVLEPGGSTTAWLGLSVRAHP